MTLEAAVASCGIFSNGSKRMLNKRATSFLAAHTDMRVCPQRAGAFVVYGRSLSNASCRSAVLLPNSRRKRSRAAWRFSGIRAYSELSGVSLSRALRAVETFMPLARRNLLLCDIVVCVNGYGNVRRGTCLPQGTSFLPPLRLYSKHPRPFGCSRVRMLYAKRGGEARAQGY